MTAKRAIDSRKPCLKCGRFMFERRADKKTCSDTCRRAYNRAKASQHI